MSYRPIIALASLLALAGCGAEPIAREQSGNPDVRVDLIAEFDGCRLFRVYDYSNRVYVADCKRNTTAQWQESAGKTTVTRQSLTADEEGGR